MLLRLRGTNPNRLESWNAECCREQGDTIDVPVQRRGIKMRHDHPLLGYFRLREDLQSALVRSTEVFEGQRAATSGDQQRGRGDRGNEDQGDSQARQNGGG